MSRRICTKCKEEYEPDPTVLKYLGVEEGKKLFRGKGCDVCGHTGYKGRVGVYEVLAVNDALRHLVAEGSDTQEIRQAALSSGMKSLKEYCLILLQEGLTTVDEVVRTVIVQN